jgi:ergothioneine biosynthesis protein EgtB
MLDRYRRIRARTRLLFDVLDESVYAVRPIALRNPVVFYEGHLPAFAVNTLIKKGLGRPGVDAHLERIFERGIDPESEAAAAARGNPAWPARAAVRAYAEAADRLIEDAIAGADLEREDHPLLRGAQALWTILEHEEMHQETLAYMWHEIPVASKRKPPIYVTVPPSRSAPPAPGRVTIPAGVATLGTDVGPARSDVGVAPTDVRAAFRRPADPFAWDNELPAHQVSVDAFALDVHNITNAQYMDFVDAGGYRDPQWWRAEDWAWVQSDGIAHPRFWERIDGTWFWRAMFERVALPAAWPVYVTWAEAHAFTRWRGQRLMTEPEFHRAAYGTNPEPGTPNPEPVTGNLEPGTWNLERRFPWGHDMPRRAPANFDFRRWDPERVGASAAAVSAFGIHDLVGNGWEWTSTPFGPFPGFAPMASYPEYSADFFDGQHFVLKGASPFTARELVRPGFRNWFRPRYPYVYATFRCASEVRPVLPAMARREAAPHDV